ncbi:interferon-inducible GTPase 5-like [Heteronotia binoei]|uniref:interferon-inducible GTPase 5-like n=1 Tax=Heteronotia binoei TaxID=13085 RepID=UPI00292F50C2|nr:interferon-inducible GTPase 5-like [Heteronotia binoei]
MAGADSKESMEKGLAEMKLFWGQSSLQEVLANTTKELELLKNTRLDIAFTGISGAGKSSLMNAFRNVSDSEEGAAKTGVKQTTMEPKSYSHPKFPEITLWDLPGIGTRAFKPEEYLQKVNFSRYDFFVIVSSGRFTDDDARLASEIRKMHKRFYFVRTKVDQDIDNERRKGNFSEKDTLGEIREDCLCNLREEGVVKPKVFLTSRWHLNKYDFPLLQKTLADDLNDLKRCLLVMAMPAFSRELLQEKKAVMVALILKKAIMSCAVGAIPIPGLSIIVDVALLVDTMKNVAEVFGLAEDSLNNLAKWVGKPVDKLRCHANKIPLVQNITIKYVLSRLATSALVYTAKELKDFSAFIPALGSLIGGITSFVITYYMLNSFLEDAMEDAERVLANILE